MSGTPSPAEGGALGPGEVEQLDWLRNSDSVRLMDIGVIAEVLRENDICTAGGAYVDPIDLAKAIITSQTEAGLGTFVLADLRTHIKTIVDRARGRSAQRPNVPTPEAGKVWRYTSPADGLRALVRWHEGRWETADVTGGTWWPDDAVCEWPGEFVLVGG
ncbi:hypothetical protein I5G59_gp71 [Mycobacterium phage LilMcDreamy]|uniref:Uncharacterized protein n=1 Tax=Mycobacterium phage LilMcDreamy TaxID=2652422 RepID=A0A5P8D7N0_9CAUD|nr:hypothetical protein I5G59_gp71 [Mycobacterium phage LilMcDreamy]QFP94691.1 hypothetical protein SEA_LILMCDREAMY_71 [Mycobacterium phage LilMcDreamy]